MLQHSSNGLLKCVVTPWCGSSGRSRVCGGLGQMASDSDALLVGAKQRLNQSRSASLDDCDRD